jgi:hypothetical protein
MRSILWLKSWCIKRFKLWAHRSVAQGELPKGPFDVSNRDHENTHTTLMSEDKPAHHGHGEACPSSPPDGLLDGIFTPPAAAPIVSARGGGS